MPCAEVFSASCGRLGRERLGVFGEVRQRQAEPSELSARQPPSAEGVRECNLINTCFGGPGLTSSSMRTNLGSPTFSAVLSGT